MSNFITNSGDASLKARIVTLIQESTELKFLVGFFYFSGINELYESLKKNQDTILKILVGLNVDKEIQNFQEYAGKKNKSKADIAEDFYESVINAVNQEIFDNAEFYEQALFLIDMVISNRLIIRKTLNPNHAKLYIFRLNERQIGRNKLFITGSSNLTKMGLSEQEEFNVEIGDYGVEEAENYFDELIKLHSGSRKDVTYIPYWAS